MHAVAQLGQGRSVLELLYGVRHAAQMLDHAGRKVPNNAMETTLGKCLVSGATIYARCGFGFHRLLVRSAERVSSWALGKAEKDGTHPRDVHGLIDA